MLKITKKTLVSLICASLILPLFSQEFNSDPELSPEELLELENARELESENKDKLSAELQQNFIIVEPLRPHELNPQLTNYASDSQFLDGLFEGLSEQVR